MNFLHRNIIFRSSTLKKLLKQQIIPQRKEHFTKLRKQYGNRIIADVHVQDVINGIKGLPVLFHDGSAFDQQKGFTFRGYSIPEFQSKAQKAKGGSQPLPQVMWWLLVTGRFPDDKQVTQLQKQFQTRGSFLMQQVKFILGLDKHLHPMTMLSLAILYLQRNSQFFKAYQFDIHKSQLWQLYYQDAINLLAKIPRIAAIIYRHKYHHSYIINADNTLDWGANFAHMLGYDGEEMREFFRGYLSIHSDYEGGNISTHTGYLVGSALSDPYLSYAAAVNSLAGPLYGLTSQEGFKWLLELKDYHKGMTPNKEKIIEFTNKTLQQGRVIPGYGNQLLKGQDPRLIYLKKFTNQNIKKDQIYELVNLCFETIPQLLKKTGKVKKPYPNVDILSGCLLYHYGIKEYEYYTVPSAVSRAMGILASGIWARALGLPIERPDSFNLAFLQRLGRK